MEDVLLTYFEQFVNFLQYSTQIDRKGDFFALIFDNFTQGQIFFYTNAVSDAC